MFFRYFEFKRPLDQRGLAAGHKKMPQASHFSVASRVCLFGISPAGGTKWTIRISGASF
jgi:hypothetical protein